MRSQFTVAVLLGIVAASAADAADLANGGGYETYSPFVSRIEPVINYDLRAGRDRAMQLVSALAKSALFPAHGQASEGRSS
ncbi:MAG: hypothetical protein WB685_04585 [Pseudolabrys sp.]